LTAYIIFQKTSWQQWNAQVQVKYNVSGKNLGFGVHNISLVYNDRSGQWYHDDVIVTVNGTVVADWNIPSELDIEIDLRRDRDCNINLNFQNTGNATLIALNFSISSIPATWSADVYSQAFAQLAPNETLQISFVITVPVNQKEFMELIKINFTATVLETGQKVTDEFSVLVAGVRSQDLIIWIIIIVGSVAAVGVTSFTVVRHRQGRSERPKDKTKTGFTALKSKLTNKFPGSYSIISLELMERINSIQGLTADELPFVIQYLNQLDEEEAKAWLDEFQDLQAD